MHNYLIVKQPAHEEIAKLQRKELTRSDFEHNTRDSKDPWINVDLMMRLLCGVDI